MTRSVTWLCLTLCNPMDCSLLVFSVHGTSQAIILEWVAIFFLQGIFLIQGSNPCLRVSCIVGGFFICWTIGEAPIFLFSSLIYDRSWTVRSSWNVCMGFCQYFCPLRKVPRARVCHLLQPHFLHIREGYFTSWVRLGVKSLCIWNPHPCFIFLSNLRDKKQHDSHSF